MNQAPLVAAAKVLDTSDRRVWRQLARRRNDNATEAWSYYDEIGEIHDGINFFANVLSRIRLVIAEPPGEPGDDPEPVGPGDAQVAQAALEALGAPVIGHAPMIRELTINWLVAGEGFLVGDENVEDETFDWDIRSTDEIKVTPSGKVKIATDDGDREIDQDTIMISRLWLRHPRHSYKADAPMRGVLASCEQLLMLDKDVRATSRSRLHNGLLLLSNNLTLSPSEFGDHDPPADGGQAAHQNPIVAALLEAFTAGIENEGAASAAVPIALFGSNEDIAASQYLEMRRSFDEFTDTRTERLIRRIAQGLPMPPEFITGLGDLTHWNAWQSDEQLHRAYMWPWATQICEALTTGYLWPVLEAAGEDPKRWIIWFDASGLLVRPDRSRDAIEAYDRLAISDAALREAMNWTDEDAPDAEELARRILIRRASLLPIDPSDLDDALEGVPVETAPIGTRGTGRSSRPSEANGPGLPGPPALPAAATPSSNLGVRLARIDRRLFDRLIEAVDAGAERVIERAANRLKNAARRDARTRKLAQSVDTLTLAELVAALGVEDDERLLADVAAIRARFDRLVRQAQAEALDQLGRVADRDAVIRQQAEDRSEAWEWLAAGLAVLARRRLFEPAATSDPEGEADVELIVPFVMLREAVARAGGAARIGLGADLLLANGRPAGGIGTGSLIEDLLRQQGYRYEAWEWEYGDYVRSHGFEPHRALDGVIVETFDDPRLMNIDSFPPVSFYHPGDHQGCRCSMIPVIVAPTLPEPVLAATGGSS